MDDRKSQPFMPVRRECLFLISKRLSDHFFNLTAPRFQVFTHSNHSALRVVMTEKPQVGSETSKKFVCTFSQFCVLLEFYFTKICKLSFNENIAPFK